MDRRKFLKTVGLLALTAPVGVASLRAALAEPAESEIDAMAFDGLRGACADASAQLREMSAAAGECAQAFAAIPYVKDGEVLTAGRVNAIIEIVNAGTWAGGYE